MIGVFDSGSGGLSVLKAIRERAPQADIVYFGDLKNIPYGNKSRDELNLLTAAGMQTLIKNGVTQIVSACNSIAVSTKCSCDACLLPHESVIEMVGPTVRRFTQRDARVLVLATKATIESDIYQREFRTVGITADGGILANLVSLIEGERDEAKMEEMVLEILSTLVRSEHTHLVLGCTHFPLVRNVFEKVLQTLTSDMVLVDPAEAVAEEVMTRFDTAGQGTTRILVSAESHVFESFLQALFPQGMPVVEIIE